MTPLVIIVVYLAVLLLVTRYAHVAFSRHTSGDYFLASRSIGAFLLSAPFTVLYLVFVGHAQAVWMLFGVGFCSMSAYILTVTLARHSSGLNLGHRMAFIVGGTWGLAYLVFVALAPLADRVGIGFVLRVMPVGYLLSALLALCLVRKYPDAACYGRATADAGEPPVGGD